jgi:hypothetical protein
MEYRWQHVVLDIFATPHRLRLNTPDKNDWQGHCERYNEKVRNAVALPDGFTPAIGADGAWKPINYGEAEDSAGVLWRRLLVSAE